LEIRQKIGLEKHQELKHRTKQFALRIIRMSQALPQNREANVISSQILRSATSVAANYRVVIEEADETIFWLELLAEAGIVKPQRLKELLDEANQLLAIFSAARSTAKS
jgi:hypothetical protein